MNDRVNRRGPMPVQVIVDGIRDWYDDLINLFVVNIILLLCWVTIILGPPATFGVYYITKHLAYGNSLGIKAIIDGMKLNFGKSWLYMIINFVVIFILSINLYFYAQFEAIWASSLLVLFIVLMAWWLMVQFYTIPFFMEQEEKSLKTAWRNAMFTTLAAPGYTLIVVGFAGLIAIISFFLVIPMLLGAFCLIACLGSRSVAERLVTFEVRQRDGFPPDTEDDPK